MTDERKAYKLHGDLVDAIQFAVSESGLGRLFKNHSGVAKYRNERTGKVSHVPYGVGPKGGGGGDLIGWRAGDGKFISIDAKVGSDKLSDQQVKWARWVTHGGGIAGEARTVADAIRLITEDGTWLAGRNNINRGNMPPTT